jgi:hypothetical protein
MIIMPNGLALAHRCISQARLTSGTSQGRENTGRVPMTAAACSRCREVKSDPWSVWNTAGFPGPAAARRGPGCWPLRWARTGPRLVSSAWLA